MALAGARQHLAIAALVAAFLVLSALYNLSTPIGEGPDEPGHAGYVFFLARELRLPVQCRPPCAPDVPGSGHHPPLAYLLAAPAVLWLPPDERHVELPGNGRFTWAGGTQLNAVAHGSRQRWPWAPEVWAWRLARLGSTLAGAATVIGTYLAARALTADRALPSLAAALVALNPQFIATSSLVSNDALLAALSAALLWLLVDGRPPTSRRALAVGLLLGLALLTKQSALLLAPLALFWLAAGPGRGRWARAAVALGAAALVAGWWYLRNWELYGDPLGLAAFQAEFITQPFVATSAAAWLAALATLHESFWARFGWMNVPAPAWVGLAYAALVAAGVAGLLRAARRARARGDGGRGDGGRGDGGRPVGRPYGGRPYGVVLMMPVLALLWVTGFALTAGLVAWQGRLLFPALPAIALLLARGLAEWRRPALAPPLIAALLALAAWLPLGVIAPAYPPQALAERDALDRLGAETFARFARGEELGAELRGLRVDGALQPGGRIELSLLWHALSRQDRDWQTFVHLVDGDGTIVAEDNREPRDGRFPMTQWVAGDWVEAHYPLVLPPDLAPGVYRLEVGLWYPRTGRRAAFFDDYDTRDPESDRHVLATLFIREERRSGRCESHSHG